MNDISELERRINAALDRIGQGVERFSARPQPVATEVDEADESAELAALRQALDDEKTANAQLEERVRAIREKQNSTVATLAGEVEKLRRLVDEGERGMEALRRTNERLRESNRALREAAGAGMADAELLNGAMAAELDALRAAQAADRAELDAVLAELVPLTAGGEGADA